MSGSHNIAPLGLDVAAVATGTARTSWRLQLRTLVMRAKLDSLIAGGADTSSTPDLALRATQLAKPRCRRGVAASLRNIVHAAEEPPRGLYGSEVSVNRREVLAARGAIHDFAEALEAPGPVGPHGVAIAVSALRDGNGPLYAGCPDGELAKRIHAAHDALYGYRPLDPRR